MPKEIIFISSVQKEFTAERRALAAYIREDELLKLFFQPYLFEEVAATGKNPVAVYLKEVDACAIYVGLLGTDYGFEDNKTFLVTLWRPSAISAHETDHDTDYDRKYIFIEELPKSLIWVLEGEKSRNELMEILQLKHNPTFRENYIEPAKMKGWIEMTIPDKPQSKKQRYRLTQVGAVEKEKIANDYQQN